jgi:hypothetical protein
VDISTILARKAASTKESMMHAAHIVVDKLKNNYSNDTEKTELQNPSFFNCT